MPTSAFRLQACLAVILALLACRKAPDARDERVSQAPPAPQSPRADISVRIAFVDDTSLTVSGIAVGDDESDVLRTLGSPSRVSDAESSEVVMDDFRTLYYPDIEVRLVGTRVSGVACLGSACATADSIRVGDPRSKIEMLFGPGHYASEGLLTYRGRGSDCGITFSLYRDTVGTFRTWCDES